MNVACSVKVLLVVSTVHLPFILVKHHLINVMSDTVIQQMKDSSYTKH